MPAGEFEHGVDDGHDGGERTWEDEQHCECSCRLGNEGASDGERKSSGRDHNEPKEDSEEGAADASVRCFMAGHGRGTQARPHP